MANSLTSAGLTTATAAELTAQLEAGFQSVYGSDINLDSDTPDGQMIGLFIQIVEDALDLVAQVYNSFDPDLAIGNVLDQRCAINGIQRQAGTYTVTPITLVNSQSVNLYGLDQSAQDIYTVSDSAGTKWVLETTQLGLAAGTHVLNFRALLPGATLTIPNTITVPVTIVLGVTSVNNPTTYTTLGINEETDAQLRVRRAKSVSLASQGYLAGLLAALENINGVTSAFVYENTTGSTSGDGVPGHSIWVIIAGTASNADIANAIYTKRNAGCGMYGSTSYVITQVDGSPFTVYWDTVVTQNLFTAFTATSVDGVTPPDIGSIRAALVSSFAPTVYEEVNITALGTLVQAIDSNCLVTGAGFSLARTQTLTLSGIAASGAFVLTYAGVSSASIAWNDAIGTIQTKVQAMTGLSAALVTGSIASQSLVINLASVTAGVQGLFTVSTNTLQTGGSVAITFTYNEGYANTLFPTTKRNQFVVSAADIVILPMQVSPSTATVVHALTQTFLGLGGYGSYTYSLSVNNSGGSINATTGVYTAGAVTSVTDTVKVTDSMGNTATANVSVV